MLSKNGFTGIQLCGEHDLTEIISYCFSGFEIELLSLILEKPLLKNAKLNEKLELPELNSSELILIASLEHQNSLSQLLIKNGYKKNHQWILFS